MILTATCWPVSSCMPIFTFPECFHEIIFNCEYKKPRRPSTRRAWKNVRGPILRTVRLLAWRGCTKFSQLVSCSILCSSFLPSKRAQCCQLAVCSAPSAVRCFILSTLSNPKPATLSTAYKSGQTTQYPYTVTLAIQKRVGPVSLCPKWQVLKLGGRSSQVPLRWRTRKQASSYRRMCVARSAAKTRKWAPSGTVSIRWNIGTRHVRVLENTSVEKQRLQNSGFCSKSDRAQPYMTDTGS